MMWDWGHGSSWFGWLAMGLITIMLVLAVVGITVAVARLASERRREPDPVAMADALLAERYARGEIDEQEYARRRAVLQGER